MAVQEPHTRASRKMHSEKIATRIYHTGINVSDMNRALKFYVDMLGCRVLSDARCAGAEIDKGLGLRDCSFRLVYLGIGDSQLELFEHSSRNEKRRIESVTTSSIGIRHVGFVVANIDRSYQYLAQKGAQLLSKPIKNPDGVKWVYLKDPDGYYVELVQLP